MASAGLQIFGIFLASIGFVGDIIVCALPMWRVSAFVGNTIVTAQIFWEGLWMNCVMQSTGQMECKFYDSMLALPQALQAARALVVFSILVAFLGILLAIAGGKCTNCIEDELSKSRVAMAAGVFFIVGGMLCLIPVSWSANGIIKDFYNPVIMDAQRRELTCVGTMGTQLVGFCLAVIGFMGTILICALPMWKVTAFVAANIVTAQVFWEGLWMNCVLQSTGHLQCKTYDSILALPQDLQGSRALVCVSLGASVVAIGLSVVGVRCTNFFHYDRLTKTNIGVSGGVVFIIAGVLCLIPVSWSAYTIITGFYSPLATDARRGELGASIYIGWVSGALLVIGGGLLTGSYRC
ncbi:claudin-like protein ZF-A89 [Girardinichthys multiradiatus]|uniref:claudin-like protein ZF-A89 n=1 Tax=Girardinichthys multiradiatus TaxID=208333 RepID=UPI001FAC35B1|nr:claudin-like protein ZF-A89 [Girardinichthys multiradiatus]